MGVNASETDSERNKFEEKHKHKNMFCANQAKQRAANVRKLCDYFKKMPSARVPRAAMALLKKCILQILVQIFET